MRLHTIAILGFVLSLMLIVAACNGDDENDDEPDTTDETAVEDVTPAAEDEDEATPGADDEQTPEVTPDTTPEGDDAVMDETPGATPDTTPDTGVTEPLMVQVTLTDTGIELEYNGVTEGDATPEVTPDATPEDEATPEETPTDGVGMVDRVTVPAGAYTLMITNESNTERSLAYERVDGEGAMTGDITPEATPEGDATPEATPGAGMDVQELDEPLQPGESTTWQIELEPGEYVFYDPVNDHRDEGFELQVTVEELMDDGVTDDATPEATPEETPENDDD